MLIGAIEGLLSFILECPAIKSLKNDNNREHAERCARTAQRTAPNSSVKVREREKRKKKRREMQFFFFHLFPYSTDTDKRFMNDLLHIDAIHQSFGRTITIGPRSWSINGFNWKGVVVVIRDNDFDPTELSKHIIKAFEIDDRFAIAFLVTLLFACVTLASFGLMVIINWQN